jgi:hypothetical protein
MSLINDALKKSGNKITVGGPKRPPAEPAGPGEPPKPGGGGKGFTVFLICLVLAGGAALGAWNYWNKKYKGGFSGDPKATNAAGVAANTNNNPIARAAAVFNKVLDRNKEGEATASSMQKSATPEAVAGNTAAGAGTATGTTTAKKSPIVVKAKPKPAWIPGLPRVQAIIFRDQDPTALIDGKTVRPGDRVGEVFIVGIKKDTVTMRWKDETHEVAVR